MIALSDVAKQFGGQTLFEGVTLRFDRGQRYGVVGANGSGKSTLLKLLSGQETPSHGEISIPRRAALGVLSQDHFRYEDERILDVAMMGDAPLWNALAEREALLDAGDGFDADRYAQLEDVIQRREGYSLEARAGEILEGLGIPTEIHTELLSTLSGGFKLRVLLAQVLAARPDLLLLDEPTNHLDIVSIRWLEKFLGDFPGTALLVSHDHRFLDNVCTAIVDLDYQTIKSYPGNYRRFTRAKRAERERREREIEKREAEIARNRAFVDRFRAKASKARQAQSKLKVIQRIEIEPLPMSSRRSPHFRFQCCRPSGKQVLAIEGVSKSYGENSVLRDVSLEVARGERVAVIGPNGIGKSTLLKVAMGLVRADAGSVRWGYETHPGYFAQDHREQLEDGDQTVESWLWEACPEQTIGFVRGQLGAVLFSKDEVKKKLSTLSGGEAARLVFSRHIVKRPNVLVIDEPTNHLDLEGIEALVEGLRAYDGTLVFVSHDRWFVSALATRVIELTRAGIQDFPGSYEEYLERSGDDHLDAAVALRQARAARRKGKGAKGKRAKGKGVAGASKRQRKQLEARLEAIADELEACEARLAAIDARFCEAAFFERTPRTEVGQLEAERGELKARSDALLREWESLEQQLSPPAEA